MVLIGIAYLTLLERKVLRYIQNRKGPNKLGFIGILQPLREAIKLFSKENILILKSNQILFYLSPILGIFLIILIWVNYCVSTNIYFINYSILLIILILSLNSYLVIIIG